MNSDILKSMERWKYPLLILLLGLMLLLLPNTEKQAPVEPGPQDALAKLLTDSQGVGRAQVLISETGVVVVCDGASNASVRLDIIRAVNSYTGFGSDKITILKFKT